MALAEPDDADGCEAEPDCIVDGADVHRRLSKATGRDAEAGQRLLDRPQRLRPGHPGRRSVADERPERRIQKHMDPRTDPRLKEPLREELAKRRPELGERGPVHHIPRNSDERLDRRTDRSQIAQ